LARALGKTAANEANLVLSAEIAALSRIIWRKRAFIQRSMSLVAFGSATILIASVLR
jgi:hypothetical protein